MTRKWLTLIEAAESLGVRPSTLRQQIKNNRETGGRVGLRGRKLGGEWRVEPDEVERYRLESLGKPGQRSRLTLPEGEA